VGKFYLRQKLRFSSIPSSSIVRSAKFMSIAAASVLAKTYRDDYMNRIHENSQCTTGNKTKTTTKEHREAIRKYGVTKYHRAAL
jgi:ribonuclease HII